jgi:tetratricopeptide (TPR) repeat protein
MRRPMELTMGMALGLLLAAPLPGVRGQDRPVTGPAAPEPSVPEPTVALPAVPRASSSAFDLGGSGATTVPATAPWTEFGGPTLATNPASGPAIATAASAATSPATTTASTGPAGEVADATTQPSNPALAERFVSMATGLLRSQTPSPAIWKYATALIEGAVRLAPDEPRYAQFLLEAATRSGDRDAIIKALSSYRKLKPDDEFAQVQLIDLYLASMEKNEAKIDYLKTIVDANTLSPAVRSAAALRCAQVLGEGLDNAGAWKMIDTSIGLNPLNLEALRAKLTQFATAHPQERVTVLLRMVLANPTQPGTGISIARELADAGMVGPSLEWYSRALDLHHRLGMTPPNDIGVDYASELFINGDAKNASTVAEQLTKTNPDDLNAWLLRLILAKSAGDKGVLDTTIKQATIALTNRLAAIRKATGDAGATTRPIDSADPVLLPDPSLDVQRIKAAGRADLMQQFLPAAGGIAWLKIYFENKPAQALPWIKAMASVSGEKDDVVARLQGWAYLKVGNKDEAKATLSPVADRDAVAALGLIEMVMEQPQSKAVAKQMGQSLIAKDPSGLGGALVYEALAPIGVKVQPGLYAGDIDKVLKAFPKEWFKVLDEPQKFYSLRLSPVRVGVPVGEPVLVQVTLTNTGDFPLTIGSDGVIHQDLWLNAQLRGMASQAFPAEAFSRLSGPLVLLPKDTVSQTVRLDQGPLARQLDGFPAASFQISADVMTNPTTVGGAIGMGPAGRSTQVTKLMERTGSPVAQNSVRDRLFQAAEEGAPDAKIRALETLTKYASLLGGEGSNDAAKQMAAQASDTVRRATADPDAAVRAWSIYLYSVLSGDQMLLESLLHDPSWIGRALGGVATDLMSASHDAIKPLAANDPDELVKKLAEAALNAKIPRRPTTQTTTAPVATSPAGAPVAAAPAGAPAPATSKAAAEAPAESAPAAPLPLPTPAVTAPESPAPATPAPAAPAPAAPASGELVPTGLAPTGLAPAPVAVPPAATQPAR